MRNTRRSAAISWRTSSCLVRIRLSRPMTINPRAATAGIQSGSRTPSGHVGYQWMADVDGVLPRGCQCLAETKRALVNVEAQTLGICGHLPTSPLPGRFRAEKFVSNGRFDEGSWQLV